MEYDNLEVLGGGGFGKIYILDNNTVLKAIHGQDNCNHAQLEFIKQKKIYDSFIRLKSIKSNDEIVQIIQKSVHIARPQVFNLYPIKVNGTKYACMLTMDRLYGLPLNFYLDMHPKMHKEFKSLDFENVQGHLALSGQFSSYGFYPVNVNKLISSDNPLRGYFITETDSLLTQIHWNASTLKTIIGFVYGWIYYNANIIPLDIEITVGLHNNEYVINVLDFGLTFDLNNADNNIKMPLTMPFFNIPPDKIYQQMIQAISIDFYCDLEENSNCMNGFELAKTINANL